jgi:hypothetical protein
VAGGARRCNGCDGRRKTQRARAANGKAASADPAARGARPYTECDAAPGHWTGRGGSEAEDANRAEQAAKGMRRCNSAGETGESWQALAAKAGNVQAATDQGEAQSAQPRTTTPAGGEAARRLPGQGECDCAGM